ncbi:MAG TPA: helix-turn-helix transcriptional regulator [Longimicrobiales bacterium]|nr:helix-turn-helix transcriptional regulator [Longimicrobiales bacterium]
MAKGDLLGEFEQMVLLAVARLEGEGYGVTLRQEIAGRTGRDVSIGSVYSTLDRLESKGLLRSSESDPEPVRGGRARRLFRIEAAGQRALEESRRMMDALWDGVDFGNDVGEVRGS